MDITTVEAELTRKPSATWDGRSMLEWNSGMVRRVVDAPTVRAARRLGPGRKRKRQLKTRVAWRQRGLLIVEGC